VRQVPADGWSPRHAGGFVPSAATRSTRRADVVLAVLAALTLANVGLFLAGSPSSDESAWRIVSGGLFFLFVPGLLAGELLRLRTKHPLEAVAQGCAWTLTIECVLLPVTFALGARLDAWVAALLTLSTAMIVVIAVERGRRPLRFLEACAVLDGPSGLDRAAVGVACMIPVIMAVGAYRGGENLWDVASEKLLHMTFVRYYHDMPLLLELQGVERGLTPPNLVNLWEFLVAAWSRCTALDPLVVACRARFVIPLAGLAGMYLLVRAIFLGRRRSNSVFLGVAVMCLSQFVLHCPSLKWIRADGTRGVFAFMGTFHHSDAAMDILIALSAGLALLMMRRTDIRNSLAFFGILTASFLWHPREYLQLSLYLAVALLTMLALPHLRSLAALRRWAAVMLVVVVSATAFAQLSGRLAGARSHIYDEVAIKRAAWSYAMQPDAILGLHSLFDYPFHWGPVSYDRPEVIRTWPELKQYRVSAAAALDFWLVLSAIAILILLLVGDHTGLEFATFYLVLWYVSLCWSFSMLVLIVLTYSELFMSTPRLIYLFAYVAIADATLAVIRWGIHREGARRPVWTTAGLAAAAAVLRAWWTAGIPGAARVGPALTVGLFAALLLRIHGRWCLAPPARRLAPRTVMLAIGFFVLLLWTPLCESLHTLATRFEPPKRWYAADNPLGVSPALIEWARRLEPGLRILTAPDGNDLLNLYAPIYQVISPKPLLMRDIRARAAIQKGQHPVLRPPPAGGTPAPPEAPLDKQRVLSWMSANSVDIVCISRERYGGALHRLVAGAAAEFELVFQNANAREAVFRFRRSAPVTR
jgi:hypothetical protein